MRLSKRSRPLGVQMNMTPMIDVTFQLIIFFMTASQMSRLENEEIPLPELQGSSEKAESDLTINVKLDGAIRIGGNTMTLEQVEVAVLRVSQEKRGGQVNQLRLLIRADRNGTSAAVNKLFIRLKKLGVLQSRIAVKVPGSG